MTSDEKRESALTLAVTYYEGRTSTNPENVVDAATKFLTFLNARGSTDE